MASRSLGSLTVDLVLKMGGFQQGMDKAARESEKTLKRIQTTARGIGNAIAVGFAALGASNVVGAIVRNSIEAEDALKQLDARIKSTGGVAGVSSKQLTDFAQSMSELTTFSDDTITSMQALLLTFTNIRGQQVFGATEAILDLAAALGTDLPSAAQTVGRALNDPVRGITQLRRSGIQFSEDQERLIKSLVKTGDMAAAQGIILDKLAVQYGGAAQAAANTFGGSLKQLENAFGDLLETDGGLNEATGAIQGFTALLRDPQTVAAAQTLTSSIIRAFAGVTEAITNTVNTVRFLGEELAAVRFGAASDDIVRLQDQLALVEDMKNSSALSRVRFFGKDGLVEYYDEAELDQEISKLKRQIDEAVKNSRPTLLPTTPTGVATAGGGSGPSVLPPSEEFVKISAQLQQQIALYGQVGEAAKIRYQIESGALDDLSAAEQGRVLRLAQQYDALVESAAAAKELEQANKQLQQTYQSQVGNYEQQIALTGEITELQRVRFAIESGGLQGITADQQAYLEGLAQEVDLKKQRADIEARAAAITASVATPQENYATAITELNDLVAEGAITQETYTRAVEQSQQAVIDATQSAKDQFDVFRDQAARNTQDIISDTLVNGFDEGAEGVLKSFAKMLQQLAAQAVAANIASKIFGTGQSTGGGGGDYGWIGQLFGAFAGGFATGGMMKPGEWGIVGERGPELAYAGNAPLNIQPMGKGGSVSIGQIVIAAPNEQVGRATAQQAALAIGRQAKMAERRNG